MLTSPVFSEPPPGVAYPCERSLLAPEHLSRWSGLAGGWFSTSAGDAQIGPLELDRPYLGLLEHGHATLEYVAGNRSNAHRLGAGAMCLLVPGGPSIKRYRWLPHGTRQIKFQPDIRLLCEQEMLDERHLTTALRQDFNFQDAELASLLRGMAMEIANGCPNGRLFAQSLSAGVARRILQTHGGGAQGFAPQERGKLTARQLRQVRNLLADGLAQDISVDELAAAAGVSKPHFARLFKNTLGVTPYRYVLKMRLDKGLEMLRGPGGLPLADVALQCGFSSQSHFTDAFRKAFGVTPGSVRQGRFAALPDDY